MNTRVLLVDDHKIVRDGLSRLLAEQADIEVVGHAENGLQALIATRELRPDAVVMDVGMPELGGVEATRRILLEMPETRVVALSMHTEWSYVSAMLEAGATGYVLKDAAFEELTPAIRAICDDRQYLSDAVQVRETRGFFSESITGTEPLHNTRMSVTELVCQVVAIRDPYTASHQRRVSELAAAIAEDMGVSGPELRDIRDAALMHDVGKVAVPAEILAKPGTLSDTEFALLRGHAEASYSIIGSANLDYPLAEIVYQHHERCNGSGYPRGLTENAMLTGAKILAVADVVEAMVSHRPYRASLGIDAALRTIEEGSGDLFFAPAVASCMRVFRENHFEFSSAEGAA